MIKEKLQDAQQLFAQGRFTEAESICKTLVASDTTNPDAWFVLSCIYHRSRDYQKALDCIRNAMLHQPFKAFLHAQAGEISQDAGRLTEAEKHFRHALSLDSRFHQAYNSLGVTLVDLGRHDEAIEAFSQCTQIKPDYATALNNLGTALVGKARLDEAADCFERAIAAKSGYVAAHYNLATLRVRQGNNALALGEFHSTLAIDPTHYDSHLALASIYRKNGDGREALHHYREAIRLRPDDANVVNALAEFLWESGDFAPAQEMFEHALSIEPGNLRASLCSRLLLPVVYRSVEEVAQCRGRFIAGLDYLESQIPAFLKTAKSNLEYGIQWANFYLAYQGGDDKALQIRYAQIVRQILSALTPALFQPRPSRKRGAERIRVGFVSNNFYDSTVGHYFHSWITQLDRKRFDITVYYLNTAADNVTHDIKAASDTFKQFVSPSLLPLGNEIASDDLDILVYPELGMHPLIFCLASMRLARVQCAGWGHPVTTGHDNIDYFISCEEMEPANATEHYSEKLALLPGLGTNYRMPESASALTREDFSLPPGKILYLVPQSLYKVHPDNDALILDVLEQESGSVAVLFSSERQPVATRLVIERLQREFALRGMDTSGRIKILPRMSRDDFLRVNQLCDVMLDTLHWSGGNTSLDAIASGLPVVTLPGRFMRGRQSMAMLKTLGCAELVAHDRESYVATALRLGRDRQWRDTISRRIVEQRHALFNQTEPVRALEAFFSQVTIPGASAKFPG